MKNKLSIMVMGVVGLLSFLATPAQAQFGAPAFGWGMSRPFYYRSFYASRFGLLGKVKIDGDVDYSNLINGHDRALGNAAKRNPYGLVVGTGELSKLLLTCQPNADRQPGIGAPKVRMPFHQLVASLEIRGVNLSRGDGRFATFEDEVAYCGRILVWLDHTRRYLLLDSADPERRRVEWPYSNSVPPERVFVEGVQPTQPGGAFLVTMTLDDSNRSGFSKLFGEPAIWDRQMISIKQPGVTPKPWKDVSPVWTNVGGVVMGK